MELAVKGSRLITVDGTVYRWRLRRKPTYHQECFDTPLTFAVELADSSGSVLAVAIPGDDSPRPLAGTVSHWTVADQLADDCRASPDGGHAVRANCLASLDP